MFRLAFWALSIWGTKRNFDLVKENLALKQENKEKDITIKTLKGMNLDQPPSLPVADQY
jgi:hypothetical protein